MAFIFKSDPATGVEFLLRILEGDNLQHAGWAYEFLNKKLTGDKKDVDAATLGQLVSALQRLALTSKNSLARTRAKLLLKKKTEWEEFLKTLEDEHSKK